MKKLVMTICLIVAVSALNCLGEDVNTGMHIEVFNLQISEPKDFNRISGDVGVVIKNIPTDVDKVFVYLDEMQIGNWINGGDFSHEWFGFESNIFPNGGHRMKLASINSEGEVINYPPIDSYFKNLIYRITCDDSFDPPKDYHYSGFYDGGKCLKVKITDLWDEVTWSEIYRGNYIDVNIPSSAFGKEQLCTISVNEVNCVNEANSLIADGNETIKKPVDLPRDERVSKNKLAGTGIEFFHADKYFVPPTDETVAILLRQPFRHDKNYQPSALFGDKKLAEKIMGKSLKPEKVFEGRKWLVKIMKEYGNALKEAEEKKVYRDSHDRMGQIVFVTKKKGYIREIDVDAYNVYDEYMESSRLKSYFYELGLTEKPLLGKKPKEFEFIPADDYFVPSADETAAILLYLGGGPAVLIGDKEQAEQVMGEYLKPRKIFEDQDMLREIMDAYRDALREAEDGCLESGGGDNVFCRVLFVTPAGGYTKIIGMDEEAIYDKYMESGTLKTLFDDSGLTDELLADSLGFRLTSARKYHIPPTDKTVAILLYSDNDRNKQPIALFGDKEQTEQLIARELGDKPFEPKKVFEGREWLEKIMDAYGAALKEAEKTKFNHAGKTNGRIDFITAKNGYMKRIGVDAYTAYSPDMKSELLKKYFDELGLTDDLLIEEPSKAP
ncbi:MAG: hypothetical protein PHH54_06330 [Candidatus Nanoarchaeia archaeon]|nr:hypothetical protein [Candidatus Nanoarchaeia archaeon]